MSLKSFVTDKTTFDEVFGYIEKYVDTYALRQIYKGESVNGVKDAFEIIKNAKRSMVAENLDKKPIQQDRAV